ncbi:helix-turn-helix domain-containing protein [Ruminococcus sp. NK3A76]|uniref:helix-turn-helix domain-containing protein n=1 Tax=Ruminococcus sp. NK3A76 TaxID=877411 RepID=UPI000490F328|nr:helix-turn-helix domain-containing protein [Ruminococcus sp. NK3A76]
MNLTEKQQIISQIAQLLEQLIEAETTEPSPQQDQSKTHPLEMLTVKECAALVNGLSEHTVRQLVAQDKIAYVRAGSGVRGKILVSKASLLKYLGVAN